MMMVSVSFPFTYFELKVKKILFLSFQIQIWIQNLNYSYLIENQRFQKKIVSIFIYLVGNGVAVSWNIFGSIDLREPRAFLAAGVISLVSLWKEIEKWSKTIVKSSLSCICLVAFPKYQPNWYTNLGLCKGQSNMSTFPFYYATLRLHYHNFS